MTVITTSARSDTLYYNATVASRGRASCDIPAVAKIATRRAFLATKTEPVRSNDVKLLSCLDDIAISGPPLREY